ncbi:MAG TPA: DUF5671 domain-containing protein [Candidatus Limnocylindrales bacterium]
MATARRLYLYGVSAAALSMLIGASVAIVHLLLSKVGVGPQGFAGDPLFTDFDREVLAGAIPVVAIGLILWFSHWFLVERMVRRQDDEGAAERASIVRSFYFSSVMWLSLVVAAGVAVQLLSKCLGNIVDSATPSSYLYITSISSLAFSYVDDAWSLAVILVALGAWAYHALIRARDLRRGTFIGGAAAWVSRFYLYGAVLMGLQAVLTGASGIISTFGSELFKNNSNSMLSASSTPEWVRPVIAALVSILIWGIVWLLHLLYANRLRSGRGEATEQNKAERTSKVRLAFFMVVVFMGVMTVTSNLAPSLGWLLDKLFGDNIDSTSLGYLVVVPPLAALPAVAAWFLHRRRGISESAENAAGPSGRRISSYVVALVAVAALASGVAESLATIFGEWFRTSNGALDQFSYQPAFEAWKSQLAFGLAIVIVGLAFWIWPWFSSQRRRREDGEIGSTSRSFYLYSITGVSILGGAGSLAVIAFLYLRLALGLTDNSIGSEISTPLALLLVGVVMFAFHSLVIRGDSRPRLSPPPAMPMAPTWPGSPGYPGNAVYPGPGANPPAAQMYGAPQGYPPVAPMYAPPGYQPAAPVAPAEVPAAPAAPAVAPVAPWAARPVPWVTTPADATQVAPAGPAPAPTQTEAAPPAPPVDDSPETGA